MLSWNKKYLVPVCEAAFKKTNHSTVTVLRKLSFAIDDTAVDDDMAVENEVMLWER